MKILRRSYSFTDGMDATGRIDAGLLFLAYMKDPGQFVRLQTRLGSSDALNEYIAHVGSGVFAVPPTPARALHRRGPVRLTADATLARPRTRPPGAHVDPARDQPHDRSRSGTFRP